MTKREIMPKLKDIALGIIVAPLLIPIMLIASYQDKKAIKKEAFGAVFLDPMINHDCLTDMNKVVEH